MNKSNYGIYMMIVLLGTASQSLRAQTVNMWRGNAVNADWNESYKWKLNHPPSEGEAAHFRADNSVITVNSTVQLENGMYLYGQELLLKGNGNINLWSLVPHERTVNIPASAQGYANLTISDNLSLNGRISLAAKCFGTSASKGTITLKGRSTVTGGLCIGNEGVGTGQVYVRDNATFRITNLELNTEAGKGGLAEIHILGGTVRIDTEEDFFELFMADPSRRIIIGDTGTLRIESSLPIAEKKNIFKELIANNRLVAASGSRLSSPILQDEMMIARAEDASFGPDSDNREELLAEIDNISEGTPETQTMGTSDLGALVKALEAEVENTPKTVAKVEEPKADESTNTNLAGYIVFFGTILLALRRPASD